MIRDNPGTSTSNSEKYKHTYSSIWLMNKWKGGRVNLHGYFLQSKSINLTRISENVERSFTIYNSLSLVAEPGNFRENEHKHI
jgi:hypothetical protein